VPPPPPKVEVAAPVQKPVTRYLDATGNTAAIKNVDLVARVQGFLQSINYQDGSFVKQGTTLFTIEPETYKLKLEQAQAAESGAEASLKQAEADFRRQSDLVQRQAVSQATLDTSTSTRANAQANLQQAQANTKLARSITDIPTSPRRSTASSPRIWSRSANWSASPRRRSLRLSSRSTRST
jgi:RND family efflux transporter MFP subunit